jgi:hypothetical protein
MKARDTQPIRDESRAPQADESLRQREPRQPENRRQSALQLRASPLNSAYAAAARFPPYARKP